jgi:hypothetical protein
LCCVPGSGVRIVRKGTNVRWFITVDDMTVISQDEIKTCPIEKANIQVSNNLVSQRNNHFWQGWQSSYGKNSEMRGKNGID